MSKHNPKPTSRPAPKTNPRILANGYVSIKQCRHGLMMYNLNDLFVGRALDLYGEWCDAELDCLRQMLRAGDIVLDVGANIGTHTVFFQKLFLLGEWCMRLNRSELRMNFYAPTLLSMVYLTLFQCR